MKIVEKKIKRLDNTYELRKYHEFEHGDIFLIEEKNPFKMYDKVAHKDEKGTIVGICENLVWHPKSQEKYDGLGEGWFKTYQYVMRIDDEYYDERYNRDIQVYHRDLTLIN